MLLSGMRAMVRRDLKDEDAANYRWSDNEIDRAIEKAVLDYSLYCPRGQRTVIPTVAGSNELDISTLAERIDVVRVEHPLTDVPYPSRRFSVWGDVLFFLDGYVGDGGDCRVYWLKRHSLSNSMSSVPAPHEHIIALGASAYALDAQAQYAANLANTGGDGVASGYFAWSVNKFRQFFDALNRMATCNPWKLKVSGMSTGDE